MYEIMKSVCLHFKADFQSGEWTNNHLLDNRYRFQADGPARICPWASNAKIARLEKSEGDKKCAWTSRIVEYGLKRYFLPSAQGDRSEGDAAVPGDALYARKRSLPQSERCSLVAGKRGGSHADAHRVQDFEGSSGSVQFRWVL
jgi:hypothetical protein